MVIATWKLAPALACGNTVVLKPASLTPLTALRLGELGAGSGPAARRAQRRARTRRRRSVRRWPRIRTSPRSASPARPRPGREIMRAAAATIKRVGLELGGKSPNIIFADVDIEPVGRRGGRRRCSPTPARTAARARASSSSARIYDRFVEAMAAAAEALIVGDPLAETTQMGPLISAHQRERAEAVHRHRPQRRGAAGVWRPAPRRRRLLPAPGGVRRCAAAHAHRRRGDLRPGRGRPAVRLRKRKRSPSPTTRSTASRARCGPTTSSVACASRRPCAPGCCR